MNGSLVAGLVSCALALLILPGGVAAVRLSDIVGGVPAGRAPSVRRRAARESGRTDTLRVAACWDLLAAGLRAGMPVPEAIRAVAERLPAVERRALRATGDLIALGADPEQAWAPAERHPATAALARAARRTARTGTALAELAERMAARLRSELADGVEARAQRAGVLITGPLGLCFLPGFLCLGVIPVVIGLAGRLAFAP